VEKTFHSLTASAPEAKHSIATGGLIPKHTARVSTLTSTTRALPPLPFVPIGSWREYSSLSALLISADWPLIFADWPLINITEFG
jgi:hypothetical protein